MSNPTKIVVGTIVVAGLLSLVMAVGIATV